MDGSIGVAKSVLKSCCYAFQLTHDRLFANDFQCAEQSTYRYTGKIGFQGLGHS